MRDNRMHCPERALICMFALCGWLPSAFAQRTFKTVQGTVSDGHHEPLKGAVVQAEDERSESVRSYITDASGHYVFPRLDGDTDYRVVARFKGRESKARNVSAFDKHTSKVVNLTIRLY